MLASFPIRGGDTPGKEKSKRQQKKENKREGRRDDAKYNPPRIYGGESKIEGTIVKYPDTFQVPIGVKVDPIFQHILTSDYGEIDAILKSDYNLESKLFEGAYLALPIAAYHGSPVAIRNIQGRIANYFTSLRLPVLIELANKIREIKVEDFHKGLKETYDDFLEQENGETFDDQPIAKANAIIELPIDPVLFSFLMNKVFKIIRENIRDPRRGGPGRGDPGRGAPGRGGPGRGGPGRGGPGRRGRRGGGEDSIVGGDRTGGPRRGGPGRGGPGRGGPRRGGPGRGGPPTAPHTSTRAPLPIAPATPIDPANPCGYFEHQDNPQSCGRHALNNLVGEEKFVKIGGVPIGDLNKKPSFPMSLPKLCTELTRISRDLGIETDMFECSENENYDANVLTYALGMIGYDPDDNREFINPDSIREFLNDAEFIPGELSLLINLGTVTKGVRSGLHWIAVKSSNRDSDTPAPAPPTPAPAPPTPAPAPPTPAPAPPTPAPTPAPPTLAPGNPFAGGATVRHCIYDSLKDSAISFATRQELLDALKTGNYSGITNILMVGKRRIGYYSPIVKLREISENYETEIGKKKEETSDSAILNYLEKIDDDTISKIASLFDNTPYTESPPSVEPEPEKTTTEAEREETTTEAEREETTTEAEREETTESTKSNPFKSASKKIKRETESKEKEEEEYTSNPFTKKPKKEKVDNPFSPQEEDEEDDEDTTVGFRGVDPTPKENPFEKVKLSSDNPFGKSSPSSRSASPFGKTPTVETSKNPFKGGRYSGRAYRVYLSIKTDPIPDADIWVKQPASYINYITPLQFAVGYGSASTVSQLIRYGANYKVTTLNNIPLVNLVIERPSERQKEAVKTLLGQIANAYDTAYSDYNLQAMKTDYVEELKVSDEGARNRLRENKETLNYVYTKEYNARRKGKPSDKALSAKQEEYKEIGRKDGLNNNQANEEYADAKKQPNKTIRDAYNIGYKVGKAQFQGDTDGSAGVLKPNQNYMDDPNEEIREAYKYAYNKAKGKYIVQGYTDGITGKKQDIPSGKGISGFDPEFSKMLKLGAVNPNIEKDYMFGHRIGKDLFYRKYIPKLIKNAEADGRVDAKKGDKEFTKKFEIKEKTLLGASKNAAGEYIAADKTMGKEEDKFQIDYGNLDVEFFYDALPGIEIDLPEDKKRELITGDSVKYGAYIQILYKRGFRSVALEKGGNKTYRRKTKGKTKTYKKKLSKK